MAKKSRERFKDRNKPQSDKNLTTATTSTSLEILKRRRYKRFLFVALIGIAFPIFELIAYQSRGITISFTNRTDQVIKSVKFTYDGGEFEIPEIKPGGVAVEVIRPTYQLQLGSKNFSTYMMTLSLRPEDGGIQRILGRLGSIDYSAKEMYTIESLPPGTAVEIRHTTRPGFPLGFIRDLLTRMGIG